MLDKQLIHDWLDTFEITNYLINDDLTVDVDGHVNISNKDLHSLPFKFFKVLGNFNCSRNNLTSMHNFPQYIKDNLNCSFNHISCIEDAPLKVGKNIIFWNNPLTSLESFKTVFNGKLFIHPPEGSLMQEFSHLADKKGQIELNYNQLEPILLKNKLASDLVNKTTIKKHKI